jgi:hypothetical protein
MVWRRSCSLSPPVELVAVHVESQVTIICKKDGKMNLVAAAMIQLR